MPKITVLGAFVTDVEGNPVSTGGVADVSAEMAARYIEFGVAEAVVGRKPAAKKADAPASADDEK
jgi:hypothetical protein